MEKKEFKKTLEALLHKYGFSYINKSYYCSNEELIVVVSVQKSDYSQDYYINYGFLIKSIYPDKIYPKDCECDFFGRFVLDINDIECGRICISDLDAETFSMSAGKFIDKKIKPVFDLGIRKYIEMNPSAKVTAKLKAKEYLGI